MKFSFNFKPFLLFNKVFHQVSLKKRMKNFFLDGLMEDNDIMNAL